MRITKATSTWSAKTYVQLAKCPLRWTFVQHEAMWLADFKLLHASLENISAEIKSHFSVSILEYLQNVQFNFWNDKQLREEYRSAICCLYKDWIMFEELELSCWQKSESSLKFNFSYVLESFWILLLNFHESKEQVKTNIARFKVRIKIYRTTSDRGCTYIYDVKVPVKWNKIFYNRDKEFRSLNVFKKIGVKCKKF